MYTRLLEAEGDGDTRAFYILQADETLMSILKNALAEKTITQTRYDQILVEKVAVDELYGEIAGRLRPSNVMKSEEFSARRRELIDRLDRMKMLTSRPNQASDLTKPLRLSDAYKAPEDWEKLIAMTKERKRLD